MDGSTSAVATCFPVAVTMETEPVSV